MEFEQKDSDVALVTFVDIHERLMLGSNAPVLSREHWRAIRSRVPGIEAYREDNFPQTVEMSHKLLGRVLGSVATSHQIKGYKYFTAESAMADRLSEYFQELRERYSEAPASD